jgi:hypothetical protein
MTGNFVTLDREMYLKDAGGATRAAHMGRQEIQQHVDEETSWRRAIGRSKTEYANKTNVEGISFLAISNLSNIGTPVIRIHSLVDVFLRTVAG